MVKSDCTSMPSLRTVPSGDRSLALIVSSVSPPLYRSAEKKSYRCGPTSQLQPLLVVGEAGIGKSVLGEAVAEELQDLGFTVADRPSSHRQASPFWMSPTNWESKRKR